MHRIIPPHNPRLEALMDERDHLLIKISMAADMPDTSAEEPNALHKRLGHIESEIAKR